MRGTPKVLGAASPSPWWLAAGVGFLALLAYANSLANGFVWDDPIILSRQLPLFQSLRDVLLPPADIPQFAPDYYRPLVIGSLLFDNWLGGGSPLPFHLTVVVAHCLASIAVFFFGFELFGAGTRDAPGEPAASLAAAIGAALFAVHPIHTEAVAWIAGRTDVFATLFAATAAAAHLAARRRPRLALVTGLALLLALLSKEVAIAMVVLLPAIDVLLPQPAAAERSGRRRAAAPASSSAASAIVWRYAPVAAALLVYAGLRLAALGMVRGEDVARGVPFVGHILAAASFYLTKLVAPIGLNTHVASFPSGWMAVSAGAAMLAGIVAAGLLAARGGQGAIAVLLLWLAAGIAPSLAILVKIPEAPVAERYLYLPSVGFCLLLGRGAVFLLARGGARLRPLLAGALLALLAAGTASTAIRNRVWRSDLALWSDTAEKSPEEGMPARSLGVALQKLGRFDEAIAAYERALTKRNDANGRVTIYNNLGSIALSRGDLDSAERYYRQAMAIAPVADCLFNLGAIYLTRAQRADDDAERRRQAEEGRKILERAARTSPLDPDTQVALGQIFDVLGQPASAGEHYRRALQLGIDAQRAEQIRHLLSSR